MEINTDVWGLPSSWIDGSTSEQKAAIKFAVSSQDTFNELYTQNILELNTIDLSAAFWGIGKGSIFRQPHYLSPYQKDGVTEVAVDDVIDDSQSAYPLMFFTASTVTNQNTRFDYRYSPRRTTAPPQGVPYNSKIVLGFNYKDVMLEPLVLCKDNTFSSSNRSTTLYDYIENAVYEDYPRITGIGYTSYAGDGSTNRSKIYFYPLTSFTVKEYDLHYESTYFWCQYLSNFLINGTELGTSQKPIIGATHTLTTTDINNFIGDSVTALAYKYSLSDSTRAPFYYFDTENELWQINKTVIRSGDTKWYTYPFIETTAENAETVRDYVLSQIAYLGLPFVYDPSKSARGLIGDTGVYLPVFDDNGITTGQYEEGINALRLPNAEWTDGREGAGYNPGHREDDDYGYLFNPYNTNRFATGLTVWCMYQQDILDVLAGINNLYLTDPTGNEKWQLDFKGSNPDDYIVSCKAMLLDITHTDTTTAFKLGPVQFDGIACYKYNGTGYFSFGTIALDGTADYSPYGDFRDYQPYTTMELYIPLCGTVDIDPEFFVGHTMEIIMMYDIYTGACTAGIYRDSYTLYKAVNGQIGADIPVSAMQMGTYQNAIHSLQAAQKQNEIRLASSAVTVAAGAAALIAAPATGGTSLIAGAGLISGAAGLLSGVMQEQNYDYQIEHTQPIPAQTTAAETQNNFCVGGLYPILYVKRAKMLQGYDAEIYSHTIGNACLINAQVGSQTGLVMCSSVDLSGVPATVEEINAIKQALGKGVYV